jgi:hypothetical protein
MEGSGREVGFLRMLACLWLALAVSGSVVLARYSYTPTPAGDSASRWPQASSIARLPDKFTLLLFAHPQCPCTAATLEELSRLLPKVAVNRLDIHVFFLLPANSPRGWERTPLWTTAQSIPGVKVWSDPEGRQARMFGGQVSGQALLYDPSGELRFSGGITAGRGHAGDNPGLDALLDVLNQRTGGFVRKPVFGCSLR